MTVEYHCRICHVGGWAECPDDTPARWLAILKPMLTCDRCYDRRERFMHASELIGKTCYRLLRASEHEAEERIIELRAKARGILMPATRSYARSCAEYRKTETVWSESLVDALLDYPAQAHETLKEYRLSLRELKQFI